MILKGGILPEQPSEASWVLGGSIEWKDIPNPKCTFSDKKIQYNQDEYLSNTCTIYTGFGAISDLTGEEIPEEKREGIVDRAIPKGFNKEIGWWLDDAVDHNGEELGKSYAMVLTNGEDYREAINRGFSLMTGYKGNKTYNADRDNDKIVQSNDRGTPSYGHAIRHTVKKEGEVYIVDNYKGRGSNVYTLPELQEKIKNGNMFTRSYFYFDKIELPMANLPEHVSKDDVMTPDRREIVIAWENEVSKWLLDGGDISKLYKHYTAATPVDETDVICRMLLDLKLIRSKLI